MELHLLLWNNLVIHDIGGIMMLTIYLENWIWDLITNFGVLFFLFFLRLVLIASHGTSLTLKDLPGEFISLFDGKEASLLVVSYCMTVWRSIDSMNYIPYLCKPLKALLLFFSLFSGALFILSYDHPYIQSAIKTNPKPTRIISLGFLGVTVLGSLGYTILQQIYI